MNEKARIVRCLQTRNADTKLADDDRYYGICASVLHTEKICIQICFAIVCLNLIECLFNLKPNIIIIKQHYPTTEKKEKINST